jgi:fused signal recognition particle receptor
MFGGFFEKLKAGLSKTRNSISDAVTQVLKLAVTIDEDLYEELEENFNY